MHLAARHSLVAVALSIVAACSTSSSNPAGTTAVDTRNFCDKFAARCPAKIGGTFTLAYCKDECETKQNFANEKCWFAACSVEANLCDNEHSGDPEIIECAKRHGWKAP
jgi:hypothetical protein